MIRLKQTFSFYLILIAIKIHRLCGQQPIIRPVLSVSDDVVVSNDGTFSYIPYQTGDDPRYLIVAPSQVRPGQVYRVVVNLLESPSPLTVTASVLCNNEEIVGKTTEKVIPGEQQNLLLKIPFTARSGNYQLKVEGNVNGVRGGNSFIRNTTLRFLPEFLTILIQTNQLVYNMKQTVSIRVILLNMEVKPYVDAVDIFLLDSRGLIMKRWNSIYPFQGFVSIGFQLPGDYPRGWWTVRVKALQQIEEKKILIERWFTDRFDVSVSLPAFISLNDEYLEGTLFANHTNLMPVSGNATIRVLLVPEKANINWKVLNGDYDNYTAFSEFNIFQETLKIETIPKFKGSHSFQYNLKDLLSVSSTTIANKEIVVHVEVGERFFDHIVSGYSRTRIINSTLILRFLDTQPAVFKPGLPFETYIAVSYSESVPFPSDLIPLSSLYIRPSFTLNKDTVFGLKEPISTAVYENSLKVDLNEEGIGKIKLKPPANINEFTLRARFTTPDNLAETKLLAISFYSSTKREIVITTSTEKGMAGEYGIFHVYSNFYMKTFKYIVVSKGNILITGEESVSGMLRSITTFSIPLSPEMAPNCNVVVYHITLDGEMIADSVSLPIQGINRAELKLKINLNQDRSGNIIEYVPYLGKASIIGHNAIDSEFEDIQGFNDITKASAEIALRKFEKKFSKKVIHKTREGVDRKALYFLTHNNARDSGSTFPFNNLVLLTNLRLSLASNRCNPNIYYNQTLENQFQTSSPEMGARNQATGGTFILLMCMTRQQCYEAHQHCDGVNDCADGSDEQYCEIERDRNPIPTDFMVYRKNRNNFFYLSSGDNFGWIDTFTSYNPDNYVEVKVPQRPVNWRFNAIGVCQDFGFSVMDQFVYWNSVRPFFITVEAPSVAVLGEQIGIRVAAFNNQPFEIMADIILDQSVDYRFVHVGPMGRVSSYMPITSSGVHQHLIYLKPYSSFLVPIPVVPTTRGKIKIVIIGRCQAAKDRKEIEMEVLSDGAEVTLHTSLLLDLRVQSYLVKFLDINVTEDPIIPYQDIYRRYVFGSPKAKVTIIGDVVGLPAKVEPKVDFSNLGIKYTAKTGELRMFDFAYRLYTLIYLRITNQLNSDEKLELSKKFLEQLNRDYVHQMAFYKNDSFAMFDINGGQSSVWLTTFCIRVYIDAQYDDWHNFIYIDPKVIQSSIEFVLRHQILDPNSDLDGAFYEPIPYGSFGKTSSSPRLTPVALTAHVLITLAKVTDVYGELGVKVSNAKQTSIHFLERKFSVITSPYEMAITTYALMEAGSPEAKYGFNKLEEMKTITEGMVYWSQTPIKPPGLLYQNQRPFIQPRTPHLNESIAVEGTAYALMIYTGFGGVIQDQIVKWLNYMRLYDEGFTSTFDTIVAIQALTDYSFRTHVRSITNMRLEVEASSNPGFVTKAVITQDNLTDPHVITVEPNVWGHVTLTARGAGLAVVQLTTQYNVDHDFLLVQPSVQAFDIFVDMTFSGRNKSRIAIKSCAKWLLTERRNTSGIAVLELTLPTGYWQNKAVIEKYLQQRTVPRLTQAKVMPRSATFMFDYLDKDWSCVEFTVNRWFPVANVTRWLKAKVYDLYEPEYFKEKIVDEFALYALHICEVCGSYQCPYCPYFSHCFVIKSNTLLIILFICFEIFDHKLLNYFH